MPPSQTTPLERKSKKEEQLEQQFLKGTKDTDLGVFCDLFSAKSEVPGQDGGAVTALLQKGLCEGLFDVAVVVRRTAGNDAEVTVAENPDDVLAASGTRYLKVNVTAKLRELIAQGKTRIAIVCTPCEAATARRIQQSTGKNCEITIIGLFCFEAFNREKLKEKLQTRLGVNLDAVEKTQVRSGKFTAQVGGGAVSCRVKDLDCAAEQACGFCDDFVSRLADVSVGSVGSREGYSTVIVRSTVGERLVATHGFATEPVDAAMVARLCKLKKMRAEKRFSGLNKR